MENSQLNQQKVASHFSSVSVSNSHPKACSTLRDDKCENDLKNTFTSVANSSSSLKVIDVDSVRDISDYAKTKCVELENYIDDLCRQSKDRITKLFEMESELFKSNDDTGLRDSSVVNFTNTKSPISSKTHISNEKPFNELENLTLVNSFKEDGVRKPTISDGFQSCNNLIREQLNRDEIENKQRYASLPITSCCSISASDISGSEATPYFASRSYGGNDLKNILQNLPDEVSPNGKSQHQAVMSEVYSSERRSTLTFGDTYELSDVSSVASVSQIAKILQDKSVDMDIIIERLLNRGSTEYSSSFKCSSSDNIPLSTKEVNGSDCIRTYDTLKVTQQASAERTLSKSPPGIDNLCENIKQRTLENELLSAVHDKTLVGSSERERTPSLIPKSGFYKLVKTKSDFEVADLSADLEYSSTTCYTSLLTDELTDKKAGVFVKDECNVSLSSSSRTINLVKECRMKDTDHHYSLNDVSKSSISEPVHEVVSTCNLDNERRRTNEISGNKDDVIDGGFLCVGTQVKVVLTVINPSKSALYYTVSLKNILLLNKTNLNAASVMVSNRLVKLDGCTSAEVSFIISPLVCGDMKIVVEFVSQHSTFPNVLRTIRLIGEKPSLKIINPVDSRLSYGMLPECSRKCLPFVCKNESCLRIPLKFVIYKGDEESREYEARYVIDPNELFECGVLLTTPEFSRVPEMYTKSLPGRMLIMLDTAEDTSLCTSTLLSTVSLQGSVGYTCLTVAHYHHLPIELHSDGFPDHQASAELYVKNAGIVPLNNIVAKLSGPCAKEFSIAPSAFGLKPSQQCMLIVKFKPFGEFDKRQFVRESDIYLVASESEKKCSFPVRGIIDESSVSSSASDTQNVIFSNPSTPKSCSSSSNSSYEEGTLDLACTHTALTWPCTSIHSKRLQNVTLRNKSDHREKLVLSVCDNTGSFKLVEGEKYIKDMPIVMEANESRKVSVVFIPRSPEKQVSGKLDIQRRCNHSRLQDDVPTKRVIPLYGYGGETKMSVHRAFRDSEGRFWLNPDSDTLEAIFLLRNSGDSLLFVKICHEDEDDCITPDEILLKPDTSVMVTCKLNLTADRVDILCRQNPSKDTIVVNNLTLFYGSEASRLRIKRLWMQKENVTDVIANRIADKIDAVCNDFVEHCESIKVDKLLDPLSSLSKLWYESITEQTVGILVNKDILEAVSLDKTVVFKDLNTSVVEH